jgi:uncharacterized membrane protein
VKKMHLFLAFALLLGVVECLWFYPLLPARVAVHFGAGGAANGWGTKDSFVTTLAATYCVLVIVFGALPFLFRLIPDSMINLPNKDYWLSPERREETYDRLTNQVLLIGGLTLLLIDTIFYLCFQANMSEKPSLNPDLLWILLGVFFAVTIAWTIRMLRGYRLPQN